MIKSGEILSYYNCCIIVVTVVVVHRPMTIVHTNNAGAEIHSTITANAKNKMIFLFISNF